MQLEICHILPELRPYIKMICMMTCDEIPDTSAFRVLPDTCAELFISCDANPIADVRGKTEAGDIRSFASFRMRTFMDVEMKLNSRCMAICFYPGAAYRFFPVAMQEVSDTATEVRHLWNHMAHEMEDKVANAVGDKEKLAIIQAYLLAELAKHYKPGGQIGYSLELIERMKGQLSVKQMAEASHLSERQLNRRFIGCLGISPKEYASMNRFLHSLTQLKKYPENNLTDIAYESGYYDQSHFIHEYRMFAGLSPGELLSHGKVVY